MAMLVLEGAWPQKLNQLHVVVGLLEVGMIDRNRASDGVISGNTKVVVRLYINS